MNIFLFRIYLPFPFMDNILLIFIGISVHLIQNI